MPLAFARKLAGRAWLSYAAYGAPALVSAFISVPVWSVLPGIYAKHHGVPLSTIAAVLLAARLFDGVCDPVVGQVYDRLRLRFPATKPMVMVGGLLFAAVTYLLYAPPVEVTPLYFLVCFLGFYLTQTIFEIPHLAWAGGLAHSSLQKTRIFAVRVAFIYVGSLLFFALPWLPLFQERSITPDVLRYAALAGGAATVPAILLCLPLADPRTPGVRAAQGDWRASLRVVLGNRPLMLIYAAAFTATLGKSMSFGLMYLYVESYLGLGPALSTALAVGMLTGLLGVPLWTSLGQRFRRKWSWAAGMTLMAGTLLSLVLLEPGSTTPAMLIALIGLNYVGYVTTSLFSSPYIAEAADYGRWKFGTDASGTYFALSNLVQKTAYGLGGAAGFAIAGWAGFDATAPAQTEHAMLGIKAAIAYVPCVITIVSVGLIAALPLNARKHGIVRRRLDAIDARLIASQAA